MKKLILAAFLLLPVVAHPANKEVDPTVTPSYTVSCVQPISRTDGTILEIGEIKQNNFSVGITTGTYTDAIPMIPANCNLVVDATTLVDGDYFYVVTAVDLQNRESAKSVEYVVTITRVKPPKAPTWQ